jgi:hypothetical protein
MKKAYIIFITCCLASVFFGCNQYAVREGSSAAVQVRDPNLPGAQIRWNNVSILDRSISNKIFVEATNTRRTDAGFIEVWAVFRNRTDYPLQLQARAALYDTAQAPLEGPTSWKRIMLPPNGGANYKSMFTSMVDSGLYNIEVREGH